MSEPFRIMLINAINTYSWHENRQPILGLGYLAAAVRKFIPDTRFEFRLAQRGVEEEVASFKPHLVGVTCVSQNFTTALQHAETLSKMNVPVVFGGIHVSFLPETMPKNVLAACLGEGELTFVDIVKAVMRDSPVDCEKLSAIPGIAYWNGDEMIRTAPRERINDLDQLPFPARELFVINPHTHMFTSRGCPYRCVFCATTRFWDTVRFHSAEYVADEIELLTRDHRARLISFYDDLFIGKSERIESIIRLLEKKRLVGKVAFSCNCRANLVDEELAGLLSRLGVKYATMGVESGNDETLRYLKGSGVTVAQNRDAIKILQNHGIRVNGCFVIGSPRETREQCLDTYNFIKEAKPDLFEVMQLTPYPGTPVWQHAKERGLVAESGFDWSRLNMNLYQNFDKAIVLSEVMEKSEAATLYKKFYKLQLAWNLLNIWRHPMRRNLPQMAAMIVREYLHLWSRRIWNLVAFRKT